MISELYFLNGKPVRPRPTEFCPLIWSDFPFKITFALVISYHLYRKWQNRFVTSFREILHVYIYIYKYYTLVRQPIWVSICVRSIYAHIWLRIPKSYNFPISNLFYTLQSSFTLIQNIWHRKKATTNKEVKLFKIK